MAGHTNSEGEKQQVENETADGDVVTLAHGAGGEAMRTLVDDLVVPRFTDADRTAEADGAGVGLAALDDGAVHPIGDGSQAIVVTTDSHVVTPRFFPGGDIGRLAVAGTVNDLAVMGATEPLTLTCSFVLEEGTPIADVERVVESMRETAREAGAAISTGDTKVMGNGEVDGIVINTAGVAHVEADDAVTDAGLRPGDAVVVSGTMGDHGIALLAEREGFDFTGDLKSDVAPVNDLVRAAMDAGEVTAMKDPTRGGLANALNEMADKAGVGIDVVEGDIPVSGAIASAGEVLGIDPFAVANEGKVVFGVDPDDAEAVLEAIRDCPGGEEVTIVGHATEDHPGRVVVDTGFGRRYMSEPEGETLPRIC
ncbi:hydrogenase expression/formation protein HypE [Halalkaliarchaeum desulfuricum]|uniref:Hydrogenase expression/formation protein HypE n=1 Tax=Halalkaliarchaeum desulfuricum TaxID=2055893 RepID=A0A343TGM8_9EURY|nr:hydrogenase expression/formation protein HypE [Halalkaliarchaeum desulfuricum]AUX08250.1 hydrogenase expression/formation protein HypE [Halalkaliarchaeum desulfuricum]